MATPILMPKQGNTVEECLLAKWRKRAGDSVAAGEIVADIETDKASFELEAPATGTLLAVFYDEGALVPVQVAIGVIGAPGEDVAAFRTGAPVADAAAPAPDAAAGPGVAAVPTAAAEASAPAEGGAPLSPRARKFVAEHPGAVPPARGSGPNGRVLEADVRQAAAAGVRLTPAAAALQARGVAVPATGSGLARAVRAADMGQPRPAPPASAPAAAATAGEEAGVPLSNVRRLIAARLVESLQTLAQYTLNASANAEVLLSLRKRAKGFGAGSGLAGAGLNDLVMFAAVKALAKHPELNSAFMDGKLYPRRAVHLGFAVDTPKGLLVPVVRDAQALPLVELARRVKALTTAAQEGKIAPDDLQGATFTVSNLGLFGITSFTPVINPPQVAILGVCGLELKPVRRADGTVGFAEHIGFSLTLDHRIVDGAPGARYLKTLRETVENLDLACIAG